MIDNFHFLDPEKKEIDANVYIKLEQDDFPLGEPILTK